MKFGKYVTTLMIYLTYSFQKIKPKIGQREERGTQGRLNPFQWMHSFSSNVTASVWSCYLVICCPNAIWAKVWTCNSHTVECTGARECQTAKSNNATNPRPKILKHREKLSHKVTEIWKATNKKVHIFYCFIWTWNNLYTFHAFDLIISWFL